METIGKIRRMYHVKGKKIKEIARELGVSKNTVKKVIRSDETKFEFAKQVRKKPVIDGYRNKLKTILIENSKEPKRRNLTAKKIYERLQELGYKGSYETVNLMIRELRREEGKSNQQVFIPLKFAPGEAFQFDWGEEEIYLAGEIVRVKAARIKLCYSRHSLVVVYPNEQLEMVLSAHDEAFKFFGGCTKHGIYDNMKTAVKKIIVGKDRIFNETFLQMASYYLFEPIACTPSSGWEKGRVEKQVGDSRRNFFTPLLKGETYDEINSKLREMSMNWSKTMKHPDYKDRTVYEVYEEEKAELIEYRGEFKGYKLHSSIVSPSSMVSYDSNMYSVDCAYIGLAIVIKAYAWKIAVLHEEKEIACHERCFKRNQRIYDPWHYLGALKSKPGALRNGAPFEDLMNRLPEVFSKIRKRQRSYKNSDKQFVEILLMVKQYGLAKVEEACKQAISVGGCSVVLVKQYLEVKSVAGKEKEEYIKLKNPPDEDCSIYSKLYLEKEDSK